MTAVELLDTLHRAGATLEIVDNKPRLRGAKISDELMQALKTNRAAVLAEFERRKSQDRDRYGRVPRADAPMLAREMDLPETSRNQIMAHVFRQPRPVHAWVMVRANQYFGLGVKPDDSDWRACVDVIAWQRACGGLEAVKYLQPERTAVATAVQRLRETKFVGMEHFGSRDDKPRDVSLAEVDRSQVYVGLFGGRYGSGITEGEYRRAQEIGLPCFIYFKAEATIHANLREQGATEVRQLTRLKTELRREHTITEFNSPDDLAAKLTADLHNWLVAEYLTPKVRRAAEGKGRRAEAESLLAALKDTAGIDPALLADLKRAGFTIAIGKGSVAAKEIKGSTIVTGDGNRIR